jgi:Uma2 family endonuclease
MRDISTALRFWLPFPPAPTISDKLMETMASLPTISPEDYLIRDRANAYKSEYCLGHMYAMAGPSDRHNVINANINGALFSQLRDKGCRAAASDQRIYANQTPFFAYPDTVVTCGEKQFLPDQNPGQNKDTLVNPVLIFEVLSDSTRDYDLGLKFAMYKTIPSFREFVAVEQSAIYLHHWQLMAGEWVKSDATDKISLSSIGGISLSVADIYLDVF